MARRANLQLANLDLERPIPAFSTNAPGNKPFDVDCSNLKSLLSNTEDMVSSSDVVCEAANSNRGLERFATIPNTTIPSGTPEIVSFSAVSDLRTIKDEIQNLLKQDHDAEQRQSKDLLTVATALCRDKALKEVSVTLHDRASKKFTMSRSERLILEREADIVFRMTSAGRMSPFRDPIVALQAEREKTRQAVTKAVDVLLEEACALVQTTKSRVS
ncbi:hypothetical protein N0V82_002160 [Gnomoniopsis sp. IMI 355080]|nr:hypothetical protein N0V82_002160 [Gnomoniopsis sp. IMI 355080]